MRVIAHRDICVGSGLCCSRIESVFSLDDEGKVAVAGDGAVADEDAAAVEDAVELCPVQALEIVS